MNETIAQAFQVMAIGMPVMLGVIFIFMLVAKVLVALFPAEEEQAGE